MVARCIWKILHKKTIVIEYTTDPDRAELMSRHGNRVTGRIWRGVL